MTPSYDLCLHLCMEYPATWGAVRNRLTMRDAYQPPRDVAKEE